MAATSGTAVPASMQVDERYVAALALHDEGRDDDALAAFNAVLDEDPWHVGALLHAGALELSRGREDQASRHYQSLFNMSNGDIVDGLAAVEMSAAATRSLVGLCRSLDREPLAIAVLEANLARRPDNQTARIALGRLLLVSDDAEAGIAQLRQAVAVDERSADAWSALGTALRAAGELDDAQAALTRAVKLDPDAHDTRHDLATLLAYRDNRNEMLRHYRILAARVADDIAVLGEAGIVLLCNGDEKRAMDAFTKVLALDANNCFANLGAGAVMIRRDQREAAVDHLHAVMSHLPHDADAILTLAKIANDVLPRRFVGTLLNAAATVAWDDRDTLRRIAEIAYHARFGDPSVRTLSRLHELLPDDGRILPALIDAKLSVCEWSGTDGLQRDVMAVVERSMAAGTTLNIDVWNLFALGVDYPTLARAARYKAAQIYDTLAGNRADCNFTFASRPAHRRIRLGYLCPYTWKSSHIDNLLTVIRHHDRDRFELYGYSIQHRSGDKYDELFCDQFEGFRVTPLGELNDSARKIYDDEIDILIDSTGHFSASCMPLAAMRPAPLVVHGTAGFNIIGAAPYYDYSLNDRYYLSDDLADLYVEKPFYMPHSAMPAELLAIFDTDAGRAAFTMPEDKFIFADFNHPCKYDPKIYDAWMTILRRVPDSVLLLGHWMEDTSTRLHHIAKANGVSPDRVIVAPFQPRHRHLRRLQLCDLALDTFYHCGGVTTIDCLIAGLPILTARPDRTLPLANASMLAAMGCEDLVLPTLDAYVEKAVALAQAPDELADLRARMWANREQAPLFQAGRWVRNLERAYEIMLARHRDGDAPAPFSVLDVQGWPA